MAWNQLCTNFDHLRALNLIKLRCDLDANNSNNTNLIRSELPKVIKTTNNNNNNVFMPKDQPHDYSMTYNVHFPRDVLPTFEDHDKGGYNFKLCIRPQCTQNSQWLYSQPLNKLFIRLNKLLNIDICYTPKNPGEQLHVRAFLCFLKEVSEPIRRCANHLSRDFDSLLPVERESVLRCENPSAIYCGSADGKNIRDRFSILVPLHTNAHTSVEALRETLAFKFVCQNSCIGRKQTCLMVLLEDANGVVLAQRWLYLRICSCPKRDKAFEERHALMQICSVDGEAEVSDPSKTDPNLRRLKQNVESKTEITHYELQPTASGCFRLVMEVSNKDIALSTIKYAHAKECVNIVTQSKEAKISAHNVRKLKNLFDRASKE